MNENSPRKPMAVNGKPIFNVVSYSQVLVEKTIKNLIGPDAVPVYHNFDYDKFIGVARILWGESKRKGIIKVNLFLLADIKGFPAIAYVPGESNYIYAISVGSTPNADPEIKPLL